MTRTISKRMPNLGVIFAEQGNLAQAKSHFRSALRIDPGNALAQECLDELNKERSNLPVQK